MVKDYNRYIKARKIKEYSLTVLPKQRILPSLLYKKSKFIHPEESQNLRSQGQWKVRMKMELRTRQTDISHPLLPSRRLEDS